MPIFRKLEQQEKFRHVLTPGSQSRLLHYFVKLKAISVVAGLRTEYCNSQSRNISVQQNGKYLIKIIFILKFQLKSDLRISSETQGQIVGARESLNKR